MSQKPELILKFSSPGLFKCSACNGSRLGNFGADGWVVDLVEAWTDHVRQYHTIERAEPLRVDSRRNQPRR